MPASAAEYAECLERVLDQFQGLLASVRALYGGAEARRLALLLISDLIARRLAFDETDLADLSERVDAIRSSPPPAAAASSRPA